jgi:hypothetical protein
MKKYFCSILTLVTLSSLTIHDVWALTLRLSLTTQIGINEKLQKEALIFEKKISNQHRLAEIRRKNASKKPVFASKITSTPTTSQKVIVPIQNFPREKLITSSYISPTQASIPWVDIVRVREAWFDWYNDYRSSLGLGKLSYDPRLDVTAHDWNIVFSASKWQNHHRRNPWDAYYDFPVIDRWFTARGVNPKVINRAKHTENDGYGYYRCSESDCTDEMIASIRTTWNYFMSEKWKSYDAHYRTIIQPHFTKMGLDIMTVPWDNRYYIVIHFITE